MLYCFVPPVDGKYKRFRAWGRLLYDDHCSWWEVTSRLGRGKIQKLWQRTQTLTSPNNLLTRKRLCTSEKNKKQQGVLLTGNFVKRTSDTKVWLRAKCDRNEGKIKKVSSPKRVWSVFDLWDAVFPSHVGFNVFLFGQSRSARQERGGRTDWRNSKTNYFIWKAALIIKQGRG